MNKEDKKAREKLFMAINRLRDEAMKDRKRVWNPETQEYEFEPKLTDIFIEEMDK